MKENKPKSTVKTKIKQILFLIIVFVVAQFAIFIISNGKINSLEGYLYSLAATATGSNATSSNATSSNAKNPTATSCNATSSNAKNPTATSSNATSSNAKPNVVNQEVIKQQTHLQEIQKVVEEEKEEEELGGVVTYQNSEIDSNIISKIAESKEVKNIIINTDDNSKISADIFTAIKNTDKQLTIEYKGNQILFKGVNIKNPRSIDVAITINEIAKDTVISKLITMEGVVVNFEPNGELPGVAKVRIKDIDEVKKKIENSKVYAYFYDETNNNFMLLSEEVKLSEDGFYEFAIEHNSKYILVNGKVDEKLLAGYVEPIEDNEEVVVSFLESHKTYITILGICVLGIIFVVIIIILDKKGIKKRNERKQ